MIVVVGLAFEARIAAGPGIRVVCSGDGRNLAVSLQQGIAGGCAGLISFGVAGGLAPHLDPGTCIVASSVIADNDRLPTDRNWAQKLLTTLPEAVHGPLIGVREPVTTPAAKRILHQDTGAIAVDMESHFVARAAADHGLPLAVIRVIADSAAHTLPDAALGAVRPDGSTDFLAVLRGVARRPRDITLLLRTALAAQAARTTLRRGRQLVGPSFGVLHSNDLGEPVPELAATPNAP